jgi:hypothetical protein
MYHGRKKHTRNEKGPGRNEILYLMELRPAELSPLETRLVNI